MGLIPYAKRLKYFKRAGENVAARRLLRKQNRFRGRAAMPQDGRSE